MIVLKSEKPYLLKIRDMEFIGSLTICIMMGGAAMYQLRKRWNQHVRKSHVCQSARLTYAQHEHGANEPFAIHAHRRGKMLFLVVLSGVNDDGFRQRGNLPV